MNRKKPSPKTTIFKWQNYNKMIEESTTCNLKKRVPITNFQFKILLKKFKVYHLKTSSPRLCHRIFYACQCPWMDISTKKHYPLVTTAQIFKLTCIIIMGYHANLSTKSSVYWTTNTRRNQFQGSTKFHDTSIAIQVSSTNRHFSEDRDINQD